MENYLIYIGKVAIAAGAFYLAFLVLFQNQKHFVFNRIYLPVSMVVSFFIPLITFTTVKYIEPISFDANSFTYLGLANENVAQPEFVYEWYHYIFGIYLLGIVCFLFHLLMGHIKAILIVRKSKIQQLFETVVNVTKKDVHPFSFFRKIVLSEKTLDSENLQMIVCHEKIHVNEKHTLDILFAEIMFLFQWFNPFAWLIKDAVKNNLEYKTDYQIAQNYNPQTYQLAMVALADKKGVAPFLTALNGSQLKNRIIMMKKKTENKFGLIKQLVVLPLLAILVMGLSTKEVKTEYSAQPVNEINTTKNIVIIIDGEVIPSDSEKLSKLDFSFGWNGGEIVEALGLDNNKIESNGAIINEDPDEIIYYVRTSDYVEGTNPEFDNFFKKTGTENQVKKTTKTLYAVDGQLKTEEEIKNLAESSFESAVVLGGETATNKYGETAKDASVLELKTGESKVKLSFPDENTISTKDSISNKDLEDVVVIGYGQNVGEDTQIKLRGISSINGEDKPLVILDGKEVQDLESIDPNSIESMTVLKDETATKIYGEKTKNGVIIITSKKPGDSSSENIKEGVKIIGYGQNTAADQQMIIRGTSSLEGKPLYIVNRVEMKNADQIPQENIENISVLKGVTGTALYGEKAKDGVVIISTKENENNVATETINNIVVKGYSAKQYTKSTEKIQIRSANDKKKPLIVVDGKKYKSMEKANVKPEEIDNITVLKDKSAKDLYGRKARNGVIVIETKKEKGSQIITSPIELRRSIAEKIKYPIEAQKNGKQGTVVFHAEFGKTNKIVSAHRFNQEDIINLDEVIVVGYKMGEAKNSDKENPFPILIDEARNVFHQLPEVDIPEYKGKAIGIAIKFVLQED